MEGPILPEQIGISSRIESESAIRLYRNQWSVWVGIRNLGSQNMQLVIPHYEWITYEERVKSYENDADRVYIRLGFRPL